MINETKDTTDYKQSKMNKNLNNDELFAVKAGPKVDYKSLSL